MNTSSTEWETNPSTPVSKSAESDSGISKNKYQILSHAERADWPRLAVRQKHSEK